MKRGKSSAPSTGCWSRREFLKLSSCGLAAMSIGIPGAVAFGAAKKFPQDPIDIIVPFSVGGGTDIWMRTFAVGLAAKKNLRVPINIRNLPGAASLRGTGVAFKAKPDGYTLVAFNPPSTPWSWYIHQPPFDITKFTGITVYVREPGMVVVRGDSEYRDYQSMADAYDKGKLQFISSNGTGTVWHIASVLLQKRNKLNWKKYVPYKGSGDVIAALYRKEVDVGVVTASSCLNPVKEGRLRPLAVLGLHERLASFPDTPTLKELGLDPLSETVMRRAVFAPPGLPPDIQQTLEKAFIKAQDHPIVRAQYNSLTLEPAYGTGAEAEKAIRDAIRVAEEIDLRAIGKKK